MHSVREGGFVSVLRHFSAPKVLERCRMKFDTGEYTESYHGDMLLTFLRIVSLLSFVEGRNKVDLGDHPAVIPLFNY
jgi:hypothetical protein